jgi:GAF domain-containing protein
MNVMTWSALVTVGVGLTYAVLRLRDARTSDVDIRSMIENLDRLDAVESLGLVGRDEPQLSELTRQAALDLRAPTAVISLADAEHLHFVGSYGLDEQLRRAGRNPLDASYCKYVVGFDRSLAVANSLRHRLVRDNVATTEGGVRAYLGVPLRTSNGHNVGALCVFDTVPRHWTSNNRRRLEELADQAMRFAEANTSR